jgi:hypothetical protein
MRARSTTILPPSEANGLTTNIVSLAFSTQMYEMTAGRLIGFRLDCMHILAVALQAAYPQQCRVEL